MTTQEFLIKAFSGTTRRKNASQYSAVYVSDDTGELIAYSYGWHYPLATIIDGQGWVNDSGYSMSTSKHIGWAFSALAEVLGGWDRVHGVELRRSATGSFTKTGVQNALENHIKELKATMKSKKRKDTQVFRSLEYELNRRNQSLKAIRRAK